MVKNGNFAAAASLYTKCIQLDPTQPAAYNNRALCRLKLADYAGAETDSVHVLRAEPTNVKAIFRHAQALGALGRLREAQAQLQLCLELNPKNVAAAKELTAVQAQLDAACSQQPSPAPAPAQLDTARHPKEDVQEVQRLDADLQKLSADRARLAHDIQGVKNTVTGLDARAHDAALEVERQETAVQAKMADAQRAQKAVVAAADQVLASPAAELPRAPTTPIEFIQGFQLCLRAGSEMLARYLCAVPVKSIYKMFSNRLQADHLMAFVRAMALHCPPALAGSYLEALTKVQRFDMVKQFLETSDQEELATLLDKVTSITEADRLRAKYVS